MCEFKCVCMCIGTDATGVFADVGHSEDAVEMRQKYLIGNIVSGPVTTTPPATTTSTTR